jgi:DNA polymerase-3 subunit delta'
VTPTGFDAVKGQDRAVRFLKGALARGRVSHAYLLTGPEGAGQLDLARALCMSLLCESPAGGEACGVCRNCRLFAAARHPDHAELWLDKTKRKEFAVETVRQRVIAQAALRPITARRRTFILQDVERFSLAAANCFLKTLEEPPHGTTFVLIAASTQNVPETILSRCHILRLAPVPEPVIEEMLACEDCPPDEAAWLAAFAGGSPARARAARERSLYGFYSDLAERLGASGPLDNLAMTRFVMDEAASASSSMEKRELLIFLLECVLYYYTEASAGPAEHTARAAAASDVVIQAMYDVESNANAMLALDAMWTRIETAEKLA